MYISPTSGVNGILSDVFNFKFGNCIPLAELLDNIRKSACLASARAQAISIVTPDLWNRLPEEVKGNLSLEVFRCCKPCLFARTYKGG